MSIGRLSEFAVGVVTPTLVIAAYAVKQGLAIGDAPTIVAVALAGALFPVVDRFLLKPLFQALKLDVDTLLQQSARGAINAALGLMIAVWMFPGVGA